MKRFILSLSLVAMGAVAFMPMAQAASKKASMSEQQMMDSGSLTQRIQQNRDMRNK